MLQNDQIQKLKQKFKSKTKNGHLNIKNYQELIEFEAVQEMNVKSISINQCNQISPIIINKTVKELNISGCEPQIIDNLQFENLEVLHLHFNKVKDIQQFLKFPKLKKLNLTLNEGVNLSQIAQLNNITILELGQCKLKDISDIKTLLLEELHLSGNQGLDITPLQYVKSLRKLNIGYCGVQSIAALCTLTCLEELIMYDNIITHIWPLEHLNQLKVVDLQLNRIKDFSQISRRPNFSQFNISNQLDYTVDETKLSNKIQCVDRPITLLRKMYESDNRLMSVILTIKLNIQQNIFKQRSNQLIIAQQAASLFKFYAEECQQ
ncbi:leucine-rich_repeat domain-containing protein [Hexamita inflata]|uniref:Leucine-rich_repeat domain-containing protein n=1 Tax=Hexamita inflata TaxID=28002 RepID=A0ABP1ISY4_9EUKA